MEDLGVKLNPITKLRIFQEARKHVFKKMDEDIITPERADEILTYVKDSIVKINSFKKVKDFYKGLPEKFPELKPIVSTFEKEEGEKIDKVLVLFVEFILEKGNFDLAEKILHEVNEFHSKSSFNLEKIRKEAPEEFKKAVETVEQDVEDTKP